MMHIINYNKLVLTTTMQYEKSNLNEVIVCINLDLLEIVYD